MEDIKTQASSLLDSLKIMQLKLIKNSQSNFLNLIDKNILVRNIFPYLDIKDLMNSRLVCKDICSAVESPMTLITALKIINKSTQKITNTISSNKLNIFNSHNVAKEINKNKLKSFNDISDIEDVQVQIENLKNINDFLAKKIFKSESFIKVCKTDIDYLKKQLSSQQQLTETLKENLTNTRLELEDCKKKNNVLQNKYEEADKNLKESTIKLKQENQVLSTENDKIKYEVETLNGIIYKLKKSKEELLNKNKEKANALKCIRGFFINSNLFKIKNIADLEKEYDEKKDGNK